MLWYVVISLFSFKITKTVTGSKTGFSYKNVYIQYKNILFEKLFFQIKNIDDYLAVYWLVNSHFSILV